MDSTLIYVIQEHSASHLHWDFRLEKDKLLKSWAMPKVPPAAPGVKRLAVRVEDHPLSYARFEGTIPEGSYGAGPVSIWDSGTYAEIEWTNKKILVSISGKKLSGIYCLIKLKDKNNWLFFRKEDLPRPVSVL